MIVALTRSLGPLPHPPEGSHRKLLPKVGEPSRFARSKKQSEPLRLLCPLSMIVAPSHSKIVILLELVLGFLPFVQSHPDVGVSGVIDP